MAQTLQLLSIISFVVAGACLILAVFLWFFLRIQNVIGDLSGRTARKSIARMRAANEKTGNKSYRESKTNAERGKITGTMRGIGVESQLKKTPETELLSENKADGLKSETTAILDDEATSILGSETTGLLVDENATAPLDAVKPANSARTGGKKLEIIDEVMIIHTTEVIG